VTRPEVHHVERHRIIRADAVKLPVREIGQAQAIVTSSPYWGGVRDYKLDPSLWPGVEFAPLAGLPTVTVPAWAGVFGEEPDPLLYVAHWVHVARQLRDVLRDDGTLWVNLGDTYTSGGRGSYAADRKARAVEDGAARPPDPPGLGPKNRVGIPWRVALALQADGWFLRACAPWLKPNPIPSSAADRPGYSHEDIFLFSKSARYYFDKDAVRRASAPATLQRDRYSRIVKTDDKGSQAAVPHDHETPSHPGGRLCRDGDWAADSLDLMIADARAALAELEGFKAGGACLVDEDGLPVAFHVSVLSYPGKHVAVFPPTLVEPILRAATSEKGACPACGAPWRRLAAPGADDGGDLPIDVGRTVGWEPSCECHYTDDGPVEPARPVPCVVYDPFVGSGTLAVVADALGRTAVGTDASAEHVAEAVRRLGRPHAPKERRRAKDTPMPLFREG
jgi:hypothetical protein